MGYCVMLGEAFAYLVLLANADDLCSMQAHKKLQW